MRDDYLWDRSGEPDPEIEKLEQTLAPLGHAGDPPVLPEAVTATEPGGPERSSVPGVERSRAWWRAVPSGARDGRLFGIPARAWALAACVALVAGGVWLGSATRRPAWDVARLDGAPR